jgi:hypothetical protein
MPDVTFFADWSTDEILATHDPYMVAEAVEYRDELDEECRDLIEVLRKYPQLFNDKTRTRKNFLSLYA